MPRPTNEIVQLRAKLISEGLYFCSKCSEVKALSEFGSNKSQKYGLQNWCKPCMNAANRKSVKNVIARDGYEAYRQAKNEGLARWKQNTRPKRLEHFKRQDRENNLKANYGITIAEFDRLLAEQDGRCAICETPKPQKKWHVDHCHTSGTVRGILCNLCNVGLGAFKENQAALEMARIYLRPRQADKI